MNEALLLRISELFALIAAKMQAAGAAIQAYAQFIERCDLSDDGAAPYQQRFEEDLRQFAADAGLLLSANADSSAFYDERINAIAERINGEFEQEQKTWLMLQCLEFTGELGAQEDSQIVDFLEELSKSLQINAQEFLNLRRFVLCSEENLPCGASLMLIARTNTCLGTQTRFVHDPKLLGRIYVLHLASTSTLLIRYFGQRALFFNGRMLRVGGVYVFGVGGVIRNPHITPVYYNDILSQFMQSGGTAAIAYEAQGVSYRFSMSKNGVQPFSFSAKAGELVAIMGGSGVGKSTLLNLLCGQLKPRTGSITINGWDLRTQKDMVENIIGYVPQDDLLMEELSVYDNLYYNAQLCLSGYNDQQIRSEVSRILEQFDLLEAAHLKVGNPLKKFISGGQRKRLNIAMELMRQPSVLFIDEPTSGLSSVDSERVVLLLKRLTLQGKLIFINIHQPSSDIYKLLSAVIILDQGGHVIYQGNPMDAIVYFKEAAHYVNASQSECDACGHVNTELILRIVEAHAVNEYGRLTARRRHTPAEWYRRYATRIQQRLPKPERKQQPLPQSMFCKPSAWKQLRIFFARNLKAKQSNHQYLLLTLLGAPLLALLLAYFTKFSAGTADNPYLYVFSDNTNIPAYLFINVIAVFFYGISASAQEIIKDRRALQRERLLHLSRNAYLLSKVAWLCIVSAFQTIAFVVIGNCVEEIYGLTMQYCIVLFSLSVCAGLIGLNLSAGLNSDASIYIFIPLILIPQILFSGVVIEYEKLSRHKTAAADAVPVIAEITPARWAYEALAVTQFCSNRYEKLFFGYDQALSRLSYTTNLLIPQLEIAAATLSRDIAAGIKDDFTQSQMLLLNNELPKLSVQSQRHGISMDYGAPLTLNNINGSNLTYLRRCLDSARLTMQAEYRSVYRQRDNHAKRLAQEYGGMAALHALQTQYHNKALADLLLCKSANDKIREAQGRLVQIKDPVFKRSDSRWGKAHFYASHKQFMGYSIGTLWFNTAALWLMNILLYIALRLNLLRLAVQQINNLKLWRRARKTANSI
jgi:ABC-type multidrug transport system ATPase subunit